MYMFPILVFLAVSSTQAIKGHEVDIVGTIFIGDIVRTRPGLDVQHLKLTALLDLSQRAQGVTQDQATTFTFVKNELRAHVTQPSGIQVLDHVVIGGWTSDKTPPRSLRLNGRLLRRGDLHYFRDRQTVELFDLGLSLDESWTLQLLSTDAEAEQIECPVSYENRNPDFSISETECLAPCQWDGAGGCWLPGPLDYGYLVDGPAENTPFGARVPLRKHGAGIYGGELANIAFETFVYSESLVRIKIFDPVNARYEVPIALNVPSEPFTGESAVDVVYPSINGSPFSVQLVRRDTGTTIFDTSLVGVTFEDQLLSIALRLASRNVYGLGESYHRSFRRELDDTTWPLWSRDEPPLTGNNGINYYGVHPFFEVVENDGKAHGVLLYNSNAMEYQLQSGAPAVVWRTIGGVLDFYIFSGPTPEDVVRQYTSLVGRSFLPPYWALGFQLSRWGYNNLENMQAAINRTMDCDIPLDVFYGDIDTMDRQADFTYDPVNFDGFPEYIDERRAAGMRYVPIVDPAIASGRPGYETYDRGLAMDTYIKTENGSVLFGNVWPPEPVSFPDFFRSNTSAWWTDEISRYYQTLRFDGLWIDMNEPANFRTNEGNPGEGNLHCTINNLDDPPYKPKAGQQGSSKRLSDKTICLNTLQGDNDIYRHYDVHSLYGYSQTIPTSGALQAVTGKRGLVFTRSSFVGSGILGGHWTGDNSAFWSHLQYSVIGLLDFNLFGLPYVGADICGFFGNTDERLCQRWQEVGAFYPFSRNHNSIGANEQDPCVWPNTVGVATRTAINIRYRLLPYFYSTFYRANQGVDGTVIRSLMHQFTEDRETWGIDRQFLWGDALLVSPALDEDSTSTAAYLPLGRWYDYYTGEPLDSLGQYVILDVPWDFIPLHVRGGRVLPIQRPAPTTTHSRENAFGLVVALEGGGTASGELFWDDGESIGTVEAGEFFFSEFRFENGTLRQAIQRPRPELMAGRFVEDVEVFGVDPLPTGVTGDVGPDILLAFDPPNKKVSLLRAHIPIDIDFVVTFTYN